MTKGEYKLLQEHALRNAIAMFRKKSKTASIPKVGLFWIDSKGVMYADGVSLRDAEDYGDFKTFEKSHFEEWDNAVRKNRQWEGLEYEDVYRGRVVYSKDPKKPEFVVFIPKQLAKFKSKIESWFDLPVGHVRYDFSDEHYRM